MNSHVRQVLPKKEIIIGKNIKNIEVWSEMPALTIPPSGTFPVKEIKSKEEDRRPTIGSFRDNVDIKSLLPSDLYSSIFDPIPDNWNLADLITIKSNQGRHYLNNAAFGRAYDEVKNNIIDKLGSSSALACSDLISSFSCYGLCTVHPPTTTTTHNNFS